jgi:tRNA (cytidine/uridine-2'-O-)-methyltransferase
LHIVLHQPEIPPNTGNIARLCAATHTPLHLIEPLGFSLDDRYLRRAGCDYWPHVRLSVWPDLNAYLASAGQDHRLVAASVHAALPLHKCRFTAKDSLLFGSETRGLPPEALDLARERVRIAHHGEVRSLNLSTAVGIVLYQALACCGILDTWETGSSASVS